MTTMNPPFSCPCGMSFQTTTVFQAHIKHCDKFKEFVKETLELVEKMETWEKTYERPEKYR